MPVVALAMVRHGVGRAIFFVNVSIKRALSKLMDGRIVLWGDYLTKVF